MYRITARPWPLSVTESMCSRLNQAGGPMPDNVKFDFRKWPVLLPILFGFLIAAAVVVQWQSILIDLQQRNLRA